MNAPTLSASAGPVRRPVRALTRTLTLALNLSLLLALGFFPLLQAHAQSPDAKPEAKPAADPETQRPVVPPPPAADTASKSGNPDELRLNFRGVPLDMVLDYLSEAAGFIIVKETEVRGKVDAWSNQPLTRDEAVDLLNTILNKNEYAAIRNGRTLTIVARDEAKKRNIPVKKGNDLETIPRNEEMVTQVIPVRHANVTQLVNNLQPLIGTYATMTVNESANSLLLTATQADVRRMTEIINALDESISSTSAITVFALRYADAKELANVVKELFAPTQTQSNNNNRGQGFTGFGQGGFGPGGFGPGGFGPGGAGNAAPGGGRGGGGGGTGRGSSGASAVNARVSAVADERSNSLIVAAPDDMLSMIKDVVDQIDQPVNDITELRVFKLQNSDPLEIADMLAQLFPDETRSNTSGNEQAQFRFNRGGFGGFGGNRNAAANNTSQRAKKMGRVTAVPDARTASIIVSAASELMPQIAEMISQLDSSSARKQKVFVYSLENADVQQVEEILKGMFERTTLQNNRNNNNNRTSPLLDRSSTSQSTGVGSSRNTGIGGNGGLGGGGLGGQNR